MTHSILQHERNQFHLRRNNGFCVNSWGKGKLSGLVKKMAADASLDPNRRLTNHSARKYLVKKLRDSGIPPTDIMQISGHKNIQSVMNYSSVSESARKNAQTCYLVCLEKGI